MKKHFIQCGGFTLEVIRVKSRYCNWAIKATLNFQVRYRGYYYKDKAIQGMTEWAEGFTDAMFFEREFYHNFHSAEDLGLKEI